MRKPNAEQPRKLRRPLAVAGFALFGSMATLSLLGTAKAAVLLAVLCGVCFLCALGFFFRRRSLRLCTVSGAALLGCLLFLFSFLFVLTPALESAGENAAVSARVTSFPQVSENKKRVYVTAKLTVNGKTAPGNARLSLPAKETRFCDFASELRPGDTVRFSGTVYALGGENKAVRRSFQSRRLFLGAYPTSRAERIAAAHLPLFGRFLALRQSAIETLRTRFSGDTAGLLISLLFGDKAFLSAESYRAFRVAGAAHLLAVSGLHLSVWVLGFYTLLRRRGVSLRLTTVLSMIVTLLVMAFALFSGSILRAGFMLLIFLFGGLLRRESDGLNSLGVSVIVCLLLDPFLSGNVGFLLSVLSTAAIFALAFPLSARLLRPRHFKSLRVRRLVTAITEAVCVSVCIPVVTAPVLIYFFGSISLVGVLSGLFFLPLTTPLLLCAGASLLLGGVPLLGTLVCTLTNLLSLLALKFTAAVSALPFAALHMEKFSALPALGVSVCLCALLLLFLSKLRRRKKRALCVLFAVLFLLCTLVPAMTERGTVRLWMLQVGQGSCVLLKKGNDAALLQFDCDDYHAALAVDTLEQSGVRLLDAVLSGGENDALLCARLQPEHIFQKGGTNTEKRFFFDDFDVRVLSNGVLLSGRGQTMLLSDEHLLTFSAGAERIHTDAAASAISTANDTLLLEISKTGSMLLRGENDWHILMKKNSAAI
ncbi:MAG: ComEC/Rec2 family competence protein [Clostridia bacterium]|nr:ComEC/Rec2 family competence protein [Clostridia bacterium]